MYLSEWKASKNGFETSVKGDEGRVPFTSGAVTHEIHEIHSYNFAELPKRLQGR